jgi:hypothetical protein
MRGSFAAGGHAVSGGHDGLLGADDGQSFPVPYQNMNGMVGRQEAGGFSSIAPATR